MRDDLPPTVLRELMDEAERVTSECDALERQLQERREYLAALRGIVARNNPSETWNPPKTVRNELAAILREVGHPLHYRDLHDRLAARGVVVGGTDTRKNVGAQLSNDSRFEKYGDGLWGLAAWRQEAAQPAEGAEGRIDNGRS